jgi:ribosome modulation factor
MITYTAKEMLGITKECKKRSYQKGYRAGVKGTTKKYYKNLTECAELETRMKKAYGDPKIWRERW